MKSTCFRPMGCQSSLVKFIFLDLGGPRSKFVARSGGPFFSSPNGQWDNRVEPSNDLSVSLNIIPLLSLWCISTKTFPVNRSGRQLRTLFLTLSSSQLSQARNSTIFLLSNFLLYRILSFMDSHFSSKLRSILVVMSPFPYNTLWFSCFLALYSTIGS